MRSSVAVPALTILFHPDVRRVGDWTPLSEILLSREALVSRNHPEFTSPDRQAGGPLADRYISRQPIRFQPGADKGIVLSPGESRTRALAYNWLRLHGHAVPPRVLLGTILEVPQDAGLDTLAAFADGSVRYINQTGRMAVIEGEVPAVSITVNALLAASQEVVNKIGPWEKPRLPPPAEGRLRMTFVVSDGLYFGEGPMAEMSRDPLAGKVFQKATQLLVLVTKLPGKPA